jgi:hypothetical protein
MTQCRGIGSRLNDIQNEIDNLQIGSIPAERVTVSGVLGPTLRSFLDSKAEPDGFASLDSDGRLPPSQLPLGYFLTAGIVNPENFSGNPKKYTVSFITPLETSNYTLTVLGGDARPWTYENPSASGFTINSGANAALLFPVHWQLSEVLI